jgi:hypothetical protein
VIGPFPGDDAGEARSVRKPHRAVAERGISLGIASRIWEGCLVERQEQWALVAACLNFRVVGSLNDLIRPRQQ